jgi:hypothetical protein
MQDNMLSPKTCCRQLFPGALIDRSCKGGRPGIVAMKISNQFHRGQITFDGKTHENPWLPPELWSLDLTLVH